MVKNKIAVLILAAMTLVVTTVNAQTTSQQADIENVVKEINYLMEVTQKLDNKYKNDKSQVRFNYKALYQQLYVAKKRTQEYLNMHITEIHPEPRGPLTTTFTKVN